jgi:hypothetical protein
MGDWFEMRSCHEISVCVTCRNLGEVCETTEALQTADARGLISVLLFSSTRRAANNTNETSSTAAMVVWEAWNRKDCSGSISPRILLKINPL